MTQADRLLKYMRDFGSITRAEAFMDLGIANVTARIADLRIRRGINVVADMESGKNRYGEPVSWARWRIEEGSTTN